MLGTIGKLLTRMMGGTRNERLVRTMHKAVEDQVNSLEDTFRAMSDDELRETTSRLRARLKDGEHPRDILAEAFAVVREASRRAQNHRQFDVQLVAGQVLHHGNIAEEATGEGKTIACYPAVYMAVLEGMHVHVVTTNDYLVQRDAEFAQPVFEMLGLTVGFAISDMPAYGPESAARRAAYQCDVTYGTNSEFGFDYLRDNMKMSVADQVQTHRDFAIVDEVDNILIDEARTPLIISGPAYGDTARYKKADGIARRLVQLQDQANRATAAKTRQWGDEPPEEYANYPKFREAFRKFKADPSQRSGFSLTEDEAESIGHEQYFVVNAENKQVGLTHNGVTAAQEDRELGAIYQDGAEWPHLITQSLRARVVFEKDRDYVVRGNEVIIVDEFTGRLMEGRQWSDGLHQAVEAKEGVTIKEENQTLATVTLQNFFKLYGRLAGMTGTAMTESEEFMKIYELEVVNVPTHRPINRVDHNDRIYRVEEDKFKAIVEEVHEYSKRGRPVLVGTTSVEKSERLSNMLKRTYGIEHEVLNARPENAHREADIVVMAGQQHPLKKDSKQMVGRVTIATNMAGRGTDIKLGTGVVWKNCKVPADADLPAGFEPDPLYPAGVTKCCIHCQQHDPDTNCAGCFKPKIDADFPTRGRTECTADPPCGLHIVGTERHEARRIDNQLRGRAGRQGDPGSSRFFLSLEDDLMRIFAGPMVLKMLSWLGMEDGMLIEHKRISKGLERAQKRVEQRNFDSRKHLLEYDEVMDYQRNTFYGARQRTLDGRDLKESIEQMIAESVADGVAKYLAPEYGKECICEWARANLRLEITPSQLRGEGVKGLSTITEDLRRRAKDEASADISRSIGEYIDTDMGRREWDLAGLTRWGMSRYGVNISQGKLRNMTPPEIEVAFIEAVHRRLDEIDLAPLGAYLAEDFPRVALAQWASRKFALEIASDDVSGDAGEATAVVLDKARQAYRRREIEYPVEYALQRALPDADTNNVYHVQALTEWANAKYRANLAPDDIVGQPPAKVFERLVEISRQFAEQGRLEQEIDAHLAAGGGADEHIRFAAERFDTELLADNLADDPRAALLAAGEKFMRREINELERFVLLQEYDSSWKDHLLEMDRLKSGIGLRGYAEQDPKIAYKREGSALFYDMLALVRDRVAENIFKVRLSASAQMSNVYQVTRAVHEQLAGYDHLSQDMEAQARAGERQRVKQIVRDTPKVGRNDPCPCGSGKKYKKCHGQIA